MQLCIYVCTNLIYDHKKSVFNDLIHIKQDINEPENVNVRLSGRFCIK